MNKLIKKERYDFEIDGELVCGFWEVSSWEGFTKFQNAVGHTVIAESVNYEDGVLEYEINIITYNPPTPIKEIGGFVGGYHSEPIILQCSCCGAHYQTIYRGVVLFDSFSATGKCLVCGKNEGFAEYDYSAVFKRSNNVD